MSLSLADALHGMSLEVGKTYRCEVNGHWVELRVFAEAAGTENLTGPMLDPWTEFPPPPPQFRMKAKAGKAPRPDVPHIPSSCDAG
jgi:hypothetical protein